MPTDAPAIEPDALELVANPGRLRILTALAAAEGGREEFVRLRAATRLTDGNLASHVKRLASARLVHVDKQFRAGKPVTSFTLTRAGREALESHARDVLDALAQTHARPQPAPGPASPAPAFEDDWVD